MHLNYRRISLLTNAARRPSAEPVGTLFGKDVVWHLNYRHKSTDKRGEAP
jgi:hypothetical protein